MNRLLLSVCLAAGLGGTAAAQASAKSVRSFIEKNVDEALKQLKDKSLTQEQRRERAIAVAEKMFDFPLMAKLSLGRVHWSKFDEKQRKEFTDLFVAQLKSSYAEKVDLMTDERVEYEDPVEKSRGKFDMMTSVLSKDKRYKMLYKIYLRSGQPQAYDVEIDGISVVRSYAAQYDQFLSGKTPADLIAKMRAKGLEEPADLKDKHKEFEGGKKPAAPRGAPPAPPAKDGKKAPSEKGR